MFQYRFTVTKGGRKRAEVWDTVTGKWRVCGYKMALRMIDEGEGVAV